MILGYKDIINKLTSYGRPELIEYSVANSSDNFKKILEQLQPIPKRALEIVTNFGVSSGILAGSPIQDGCSVVGGGEGGGVVGIGGCSLCIDYCPYGILEKLA